MVTVIPTVIGALRTIQEGLEKKIGRLRNQSTALLRLSSILSIVLET